MAHLKGIFVVLNFGFVVQSIGLIVRNIGFVVQSIGLVVLNFGFVVQSIGLGVRNCNLDIQKRIFLSKSSDSTKHDPGRHSSGSLPYSFSNKKN